MTFRIHPPIFSNILLLNIAPTIVISEHFPLPNSTPSIVQKKITLPTNSLVYSVVLILGILYISHKFLTLQQRHRKSDHLV